jgi:hypothetical protein
VVKGGSPGEEKGEGVSMSLWFQDWIWDRIESFDVVSARVILFQPKILLRILDATCGLSSLEDFCEPKKKLEPTNIVIFVF